MITSEQMSAAQRAYEFRLEREWEARCEAEDERNYCHGECETCKVPYCTHDFTTNPTEENDDDSK